MKRVRLFKASWCPHCVNALQWIDELKAEDSKYNNVDLTVIDIDNEKEKLADVDFYYVPTFYVDNDKAFEGVPSKEIIKGVFDSAL